MVNRWLQHLKKFSDAHPQMKYGEAMKKARASYKPDPNAAKKREQRKKEFFAKIKPKKRK